MGGPYNKIEAVSKWAVFFCMGSRAWMGGEWMGFFLRGFPHTVTAARRSG
jgi:hypothetical protein